MQSPTPCGWLLSSCAFVTAVLNAAPLNFAAQSNAGSGFLASIYKQIFDTHFMPHAVCLSAPDVLWLHVVSDGLIAIAYAAIPFALLRLVRTRKDLSFPWMFAFFAIFIFCCGATHVFAIVTLWTPVYRLEGLVKFVTAVASIASAIFLFRLIPHVAGLPSLAAGSVRQLSDSMPQIVWAARPDGSVDHFNQRWYDYTGMSREQSKSGGWQFALYPDDLQTAINSWKSALISCDPYAIEVRLKRASDNVYRWHLIRALPIRNAQGTVVRWFGTGTDIEDYKRAEAEIKALNENLEERVRERTAELAEANRQLTELNGGLKQAEQRGVLLAAIVDSSDDAIISESLQGIITSWNAGAESLFGYAAGEAVGRHASLIVGPEGVEREAQFLEQIREGEVIEQLETTRIHKSGQGVQVSLKLSPVRNASGEITGASKILRDVSDRLLVQGQIMDLNRQLKEAAIDAERANRAKSIFLSTMSHEIRTPLNAILGYVQLMLRDRSLGADAKGNLKIIGRSGEHLLGLINDVLDMSKIEAGRTELSSVTFNLSRLLNDLAGIFRLRAEAKALQFELLADEESSLSYVVADEGKIRQVLINLLGNAIRLTTCGHVKLHIALDDKGGDKLWLSARVEDTGPGISEEEQKRLFQPFNQAKSAPNTQEGTGLGLAISRQYARLMGGDITLTSSPGKGSIFHLEIPIERGDAGVAFRTKASRRVISLRPGTEAPHILVVDDQLQNRDSLMQLLACVGYSVRGAENGEAAIRNWKEWMPQMILMDMHMPVMNGLEATRRIKSDPRGKETVIVVLTASALDEDRRTVAESGADDFLAKPCPEDDLFERMRALLGVTYDYADVSNDEDEPFASSPPLSAGSLRQLPPELLQELRDATLSGNKRLLDKLIVKVRDSADMLSATGLQQLANNYDYDSLMRVLE